MTRPDECLQYEELMADLAAGTLSAADEQKLLALMWKDASHAGERCRNFAKSGSHWPCQALSNRHQRCGIASCVA